MHSKEIIELYRARRAALEALAAFLAERLGHTLAAEAIKIHGLTARVKTPESLAEKLSRPDKIYRSLDDVTDLVGLRVITYFEDSVDEVAALLERTFCVDLEHSIDRRATSEEPSFGYQSLHYVCRLSPEDRPSCPDPAVAEVRFEVQLRTVLQHAWAEIEHDLGYKSRAQVPSSVRRKLSRLAGLLEIADEEFVAIRRSLTDYARDVRDKLDQGALTGAVPLDLLSLVSFLRSERGRALDERLSLALDKPLSGEPFFPDYLLKMLAFLGIVTVADLSLTMESLGREVLDFVGPYFSFTREAWGFDGRDMAALPRGYSVLLAGHLLVLRRHPLAVKQIEAATRFFAHLDYPDDEEAARRIARAFVELCGGARG